MDEDYTDEKLELMSDDELMANFVIKDDQHLTHLNEILKRRYSSMIDE